MPWYNSKGEIVPDELVAPMPTPTPRGAAPPGPVTKIPGKTILGAAPPPDPDPEREAYYRSHPAFAAWNRPLTEFVRGGLEALDPGPRYVDPRQAATQAYRFPTDVLSPKDWAQTALTPLWFMQGLGEAKVLRELAEQIPEARTILKPAAEAAAKASEFVGKSWPRRLTSSTITGGAAGTLAGDSPRKSASEGFGGSLTGEALAMLRPVARMFGAPGYRAGVNTEIGKTIEKHLPGVKAGPGELSDLAHGNTIVDETAEKLKGIRDRIDNQMAGKKVKAPHVTSAKDIREPREKNFNLKKAEKQLTNARDFSYDRSGRGKANLTARKATDLIRKYRNSIANEINAHYPGQFLGELWRGWTNTMGKANALARLLKEDVIDHTSGMVNPQKWGEAVLKHWDDLADHFGTDGARELEHAGGARKGMIPQEAEKPHFGFRLHGGLPVPHAGPGRTLRPPRVPANITSYWPRGFFSIAPGISINQQLQQQLFGRQRLQPPPPPPPVSTTPPP